MNERKQQRKNNNIESKSEQNEIQKQFDFFFYIFFLFVKCLIERHERQTNRLSDISLRGAFFIFWIAQTFL